MCKEIYKYGGSRMVVTFAGMVKEVFLQPPPVFCLLFSGMDLTSDLFCTHFFEELFIES